MRTRSIALILGTLVFGAALAEPASDAAPVAPFQADYEVLRNGKELGRATLMLRSAGDGTWEFSNQTKGTKGMASLLGVDVVEKSTFRWHDGQPEGLRYSYSQEAAIKSRQRSTEFDWRTHEAQSRDGKNVWTAPLQNSAMDRNLVTVALMAQLKSGGRDLTFHVVDKDKVAEQRYAQSARETLSLPAGRIEAVRVQRQRADNSRTTTSWFAPQRNWLPVQIEQVEKNGETITMRLAAQP
ncbi:MAG TPA: DUF3108 domain-containing protein [Rhodanobacteraceae bacterium]|nr:DUF3108 domain-containing protein [Rhodanobacteraceae bacterium]